MSDELKQLEQEAIEMARREYHREAARKHRAEKKADHERIKHNFYRNEAIKRGFIIPEDNQ